MLPLAYEVADHTRHRVGEAEWEHESEREDAEDGHVARTLLTLFSTQLVVAADED